MIESIDGSIKSGLSKLNQNVILFWLGKSWSYLTEILLYVTGIACIGFNFIMQNVFPFHVLDEILHRPTLNRSFPIRVILNLSD
ncbi:MAG: hypothetical protein HWD58_03175 [Bacteroidota bacterium]|nr:MAG: hypothetical protein HWD58_03175 [Bacteroidota bacterium]